MGAIFIVMNGFCDKMFLRVNSWVYICCNAIECILGESLECGWAEKSSKLAFLRSPFAIFEILQRFSALAVKNIDANFIFLSCLSLYL